jgi:sugar phosphate isomerase/epimerase
MMPLRFRIGVDSYSLQPLGLSPFELLDWVKANGGEGVQFSEIPLPERVKPDRAFLKDLARYAAEKRLYLEWGGGQHIPFDVQTGEPIDIFRVNRRAAEQASLLGIRSVRSCSGGLMRWRESSPPTETILRAMAESLRAQRRMLEDLGVTLAIETHFEFTTFELRRLFERCEAEPGGFLGICLDTMNLLTMLEDPVRAVKRILPWVVTTHIKDGGILLTEKGFVSFPVEVGKGVVDFRTILGLFSALERPLRLSLEDHGGDFLIPIFDEDFLRGFPDLTTPELASLLRLALKTRESAEKGRIAIVERSRWPEICKDRVKQGLHNLKNIAGAGFRESGRVAGGRPDAP